MPVSEELKKQVEAAFGYRGHVTVVLADGTWVEGYLFNRVYDNARLPQDNFIDLVLKNSDERRRVPLASVVAVKLTGKDHAENYGAYLERTGGKLSAPDREP